MNITLRFFASVREQLGTAQENLTLPAGVGTVGQVRQLLQQRGGVWSSALGDDKSLRTAVNHSMCDADTPVADGGELAFVPPVTGG
jgi:molybdopterin synthase sulfur carrier subunit